PPGQRGRHRFARQAVGWRDRRARFSSRVEKPARPAKAYRLSRALHDHLSLGAAGRPPTTPCQTRSSRVIDAELFLPSGVYPGRGQRDGDKNTSEEEIYE